jgi:hypothetical protein
MKLALGVHAPLPDGMSALHQASVDIHGPNTMIARFYSRKTEVQQQSAHALWKGWRLFVRPGGAQESPMWIQ